MNEKNFYPFYNGDVKKISLVKWFIILVSVIISFTLMLWIESFLPTNFIFIQSFKVIFLFMLAGFTLALLPLLAMQAAIGSEWKQLFKPIQKKDIKTVLIYILFVIFFNIISGILVNLLGGGNGDYALGDITIHSQNGWYAFILNNLESIPQLFGEELLALLPLLAIYAGLINLNVSKKVATGIALIVSSAIFGLVHLPAYQWDFVQVIIGLGLVRIPISWLFIKTKNIWLTFLVHYFYDFILFSVIFFIG